MNNINMIKIVKQEQQVPKTLAQKGSGTGLILEAEQMLGQAIISKILSYRVPLLLQGKTCYT